MRARPPWRAGAAALLALAVFGIVQQATPGPVGVDGLFHLQSANLIRENLPKPWISDFRWLELTAMKHDLFADFYWGFHLLLVPFTFLPVEAAVKIAPVVLAALSFLALYFVLARLGVTHRLFWFSLALLSSPVFLMRLSQNKAPVPTLGLLLLLVWAAVEGRVLLVAVFAALATWVYPILPIIGVLGAAAIAGRGIGERRVPWRPLAGLACGTAAGLLAHPDFPRNLAFLYVNLVEAVGLGAGEFAPFRADVFLTDAGVLVAAYGLAFRCAGFGRGDSKHREAWAFFLASTVLWAVTMRHMRGIDFLPPFVALFGAVALDGELGRLIAAVRRRLPELSEVAARAAVAGLLLVAVAGVQVARARVVVARNSSGEARRLEGAARWLVANTAPGEMVLNLSAGDFEQLWLYDTHNTYFVGFNVNFLQRQSPALFREYARFYERGNLQAIRDLLAGRVGARYLVASDRLPGSLFQEISASPFFEPVYRDRSCVIARVRPSS